MKNVIILMSFCTILLSTSCTSEKKEKEIVKYLVTSPLLLDTTAIYSYVGQINAINHIELRSQERGYLQKIYVDEGSYVKKGQLLFKIMPNLYEAEYGKSRAEARLAEIEYLNTKALADSNIVSKNELAMAKARYDKALAEQSLRKTHVGFTEIRAPFDGIIDRFRVRLGSLVDEGELLTNLSDNHQMWAYFNVPEAEYLNYQSKLIKDKVFRVDLELANGEMFDYHGIVETIEGDFNNETGNIAFRATFDNPDKLLRHGETGNILVSRVLKNALIIPQKATFEVLEKKYVFVIDKAGKVTSREIVIDAELPHIFVLKSGLKAEDRILLEGLRLVRENEIIKVNFQDPQKVISELELYAE